MGEYGGVEWGELRRRAEGRGGVRRSAGSEQLGSATCCREPPMGGSRALRHAPNIKIGGRGEEQRSIADNARQNWCNISSMCGTTLRRPGTEVSLALHIRFVVVAVAVAVAVLVVGGGVEHAGAPPCAWKGEEDHRTVRTPEAVGRRGR